jgi:hypothetical protein
MRCSLKLASKLAALSVASTFGCTPDVGTDPVPEAMEFDTEAAPPRVPQPTGLVVNPATGHIDFSLAGTPLPEDCDEPSAFTPAECGFNQYLETLDGFPTVAPATAPATAELDADTLTLGENVIVFPVKNPSAAPEIALGFDPAARALRLRPTPAWEIGETYFVAVRGYGGGVRAASGSEVVGSPTMSLIKEDESLTCGAATPDAIDPDCPALRLLSQSQPEEQARASVFTLEAIRSGYQAGGVWDAMAALGLPKSEVAVLWGFPVHSASVAEIDPAAGLLPRVTAPDEIRVAVHGPVDAASVTAFVVKEQAGSVVLMDLTAAAGGDLVAGFPRVAAAYEDGEIVFEGSDAFVPGHQYGVFMTRDVKAPDGRSLVPAPISVLLSSAAPLVDDDGNSQLSTVPDADAALLEVGRAQLATLFDNPVFGPLTGITRETLVYCFAFAFPELP